MKPILDVSRTPYRWVPISHGRAHARTDHSPRCERATPVRFAYVFRRRVHCVAHILACVTVSALHVTASTPAAAVYFNGPIITLDAENRIVEAVAVRGDTIVFAGPLDAAREAAGAGAADINLHGHTLLPGFYAPHDHLNASPAVYRDVDLNSPPVGRVESIEDIVTALRERAAATPPGLWITGRGYDDTLVREKRHPTRHDLDRASNVHPIWILHTSGHLSVANSRALALAGINADTRNPANGVIRREPDTNVPNGVFEQCNGLISRHVPATTPAQRIEAYRAANLRYLARGVTTTVIADGGKQTIDDIRAAMDRGFVDLRVVAMLSGGTKVPARPADAAAWSDAPERIHAGAIKLWQDGSIQGYTGYLTEPYHRQPDGKEGYRGYAARPRETLVKMVADYHQRGYQLAIHGNGDAAIDDILFALAEAQRLHPREDARHRIEHCQTPREDQLDTMRKLGISPSFFVGHVYFWGDRHREIFLGPERAARISPLRSARERGLRFTVHNDTPVTPIDPLLLVWAAVNRETREGKVLGCGQRISVVEALRAVTSDAAWQNFEEKRKGSIEPGKLADFVVLAENPLEVPSARLKDIRIEETIIGGRSVFRRRP